MNNSKSAVVFISLIILLGSSCKEEKVEPEIENQALIRSEMFYPTIIEANKYWDGFELYFSDIFGKVVYIFTSDTFPGTFTVFGDTLQPGEKCAIIRDQKAYPGVKPAKRGVVNLNVHPDGSLSGTYSGDLASTKLQEVYIRNGKFKISGSEVKDKVKARAVTDIEGYTYKTVLIGRQIWMAEDLRTTTFADGSKIEIIEDNAQWAGMPSNRSSKFCCFYNNDSSLDNGVLYSFGAAIGNNEGQGACPDGWHLPGPGEWIELLSLLQKDGYYKNEGLALKDTSSWLNNGNGIDAYGFGAKASGNRIQDNGTFSGLGKSTIFWSSEQYDSYDGNGTAFEFYGTSQLVLPSQWKMRSGLSVRCVLD